MLDIPEFNLSLIRHGESQTNSTPDIMGQTCEDPLTDLGKQQAKELYDWYQKNNQTWDLVYSSHYHRALNTAMIATGYEFGKIIISSDLREYSAGDWLGVSRSQTLTTDVKVAMNYLTHNFQPPGGESLSQVQRRVGAWMENEILYNQEFLHFNKELGRPVEIAAFSHGLTIKCLLQYIMGFDKAFTWKVLIDNTSISRLSFGKEGWRVYSINERPHLISR